MFLKKSRQTPAGGGEKSLYPILHVASVLKDYQKTWRTKRWNPSTS